MSCCCHGKATRGRAHPPAPHAQRGDCITSEATISSQTSPTGQVQDFFKTGARLTTAAHLLWEQLLQPGDMVVDATCGNGNDTAFLSERVGPTGTVYAFDIQEAAIASTLRCVEGALGAEQRPHLHLVCGCHSEMLRHVGEGTASLVCFNLGYLPTADKSVVTQRGTTVAAIQAATKVLKQGGMLCILCYTGHPGGIEEYKMVLSLMEGLSPKEWTTMEHRLTNRATAPILEVAWKKTAKATS